MVEIGWESSDYVKKRDETPIIELTIINDSINLLQSIPAFGNELHGFLVPAMQSSLHNISTIYKQIYVETQ
jgi:hypothetical protein